MVRPGSELVDVETFHSGWMLIWARWLGLAVSVYTQLEFDLLDICLNNQFNWFIFRVKTNLMNYKRFNTTTQCNVPNIFQENFMTLESKQAVYPFLLHNNIAEKAENVIFCCLRKN